MKRNPSYRIPPVHRYLNTVEIEIRLIENLFNWGFGEHVRIWFTCKNKIPMSRRRARAVKREHNNGGHGIATIYRCSYCGRWHVHSVLNRMDVVIFAREEILRQHPEWAQPAEVPK